MNPAQMQQRFLFVAQRPWRGATPPAADGWDRQAVAVDNLWRALEALGLDLREQRFMHIYRTVERVSAADDAADLASALVAIRDCARSGFAVVALGAGVGALLDLYDLPCTTLTHPAARGALRRRARYQRHVAEVLGPLLGPGEVAA